MAQKKHIVRKSLSNMHWIRVQGGSILVRIPIPDSDNECVQKSFRISRYKKGELSAINAARRFRDIEGEKLYGDDYWIIINRGRFKPKIVSLDKIAEKGVTKTILSNGTNWCATWRVGPPEDRQTKSKSFSVNKYGDSEAKSLAIEARKKGVESDLLTNIVALPASEEILKNKAPGGIGRSQYKSGEKIWEVKAHWRNGKPMVTGCFADKHYRGSPALSLSAAEEFLKKETTKLLRKKVLSRDKEGHIVSGKRQPRPSNKPSGIAGVHLYKEELLDGGFSYHWSTIWQEGGHGRKRRFPLSKYRHYDGEPPAWWAFVEAVATRISAEKRVYGYCKIPTDINSLKQAYLELIGTEPIEK